MATTPPPAPAEASGSGKKKLIILIVVGALVLVGGGVGVTFMLMHGKADKAASARHKADKGEDGGDEAAADSEEADKGEADKGEKGEGKGGKEPIYVALEPAFVVNFQDEKKHTKFLKAEISVLVKSEEARELIKQNLPAVRNNLVMLLSKQVFEELLTPEGKEKLRLAALEEVKGVLTKLASAKKAKGVADLYFSSLVMQ